MSKYCAALDFPADHIEGLFAYEFGRASRRAAQVSRLINAASWLVAWKILRQNKWSSLLLSVVATIISTELLAFVFLVFERRYHRQAAVV